MATRKIHHQKITFDIVTEGGQPLELDEHTKDKLLAAFEVALSRHVDLRYHPDGNRFQEDYHRLLGTEIVEESK